MFTHQGDTDSKGVKEAESAVNSNYLAFKLAMKYNTNGQLSAKQAQNFVSLTNENDFNYKEEFLR